jgi:hypothetical protein
MQVVVVLVKIFTACFTSFSFFSLLDTSLKTSRGSLIGLCDCVDARSSGHVSV